MPYRILKSSLLGKPLEKSRHYTIAGAGIAGLLLGFHLKKAGFSFRIVEQSSRPGGMLGSHQLSSGLAEQAANGFLWCPEMQEMCDDLKLEILPHKSEAKARYLVRNKKLRRYPLNLPESLELVARLLWPHGTPHTIRAFGDSYGGKAFSRQLLAPAFNGIYGADISKLSLPGAATMLAKLLNDSAWLPAALWKNKARQRADKPKKQRLKGSCSFQGGMQELVDKLGIHLNDHIQFNVNGLDLVDSTDNLILCCPAPVAAAFFTDALQERLQQLEYTSLISATLIFKRTDVAQFKPGFGCLIPREEGMQLLGLLFNSCIFEHRVNKDDLLSLTCMLRADAAMLDKTDEELIAVMVDELNLLFQLNGKPLEYRLFKWPAVIPLYSPELYESWFAMDRILKAQYPNRNLFGNYTGEISIRGMCQMAAKAVKPSLHNYEE